MAFSTLLTTAEMYQADALTIANGISGIELMENAGRAVVDEIRHRWEPRETVVLCGPGNNGGDGFVVARLLAKAGWPVRLALFGDFTDLSGDAALAAEAWSGPIEGLTPNILLGMPLVVDGLFGAGLSRELSGVVFEVVEQINLNQLDCVAIDVPSGVQGDSGHVMGTAPRCCVTVTFFRAKPAHYLMPAKTIMGDVRVAHIGIDREVLEKIDPCIFLNGPALWSHKFPQPEPDAHKFKRGHLLVTGGDEMTGAARLVARAARRAGSGMVTVSTGPDTWPIYASDQPGLLVKQISSTDEFRVLVCDRRVTALVIGPGFGRGLRTREWVLEALLTGKPIVVDADALSAFADRPEELIGSLHNNCVLTPHDGEFAGLFKVGDNKLEDAKNAAVQTGACILLKGADTVISDASGNAIINQTGTPYLATAGSGDVLAGLIGGLLAQGMAPLDAASAGAWMHGIAAEQFGPGLIAEDIPELIPEITRTIIKMSSETS